MSTEKNTYKLPIPNNLSFDEESLFWRLRLGEGIPNRAWHKPLDRKKSWHEIKSSLDKKMQVGQTYEVFKKIYPRHNCVTAWLNKLIKSIKIAFFLTD